MNSLLKMYFGSGILHLIYLFSYSNFYDSMILLKYVSRLFSVTSIKLKVVKVSMKRQCSLLMSNKHSKQKFTIAW